MSKCKLYVAYLRGELAGMTLGYTDVEAKTRFAKERKVRTTSVEVKWTGRDEVSFEEYVKACELQGTFLA